jgi:tRNA modification GTPase
MDTIAAISTPHGEGGIGIVRISGDDALKIAKSIFKPSKKNLDITKSKTFIIHYGWVINPLTGEKIDEVILSIMLKPHSYTKEDVVEFNCHGGLIPLKNTLGIILKNGARIAQPGEFTKRAFLNGRIDLIQAESVIELIRAKTAYALRCAFSSLEGRLTEYLDDLKNSITETYIHFEALIEFSQQDIDIDVGQGLALLKISVEKCEHLLKAVSCSEFLREYARVVVAGKKNVGKSSLVNAILKKDRCIVTSIPGTTRDIVRDMVDIKGIPVYISDTAGIGSTEDIVEKEGISRAKTEIRQADLVLFVLDSSMPIDDDDRNALEHIPNVPTICVINKIDLETNCIDKNGFSHLRNVRVSALKAIGIEELESAIADVLMGEQTLTEGERFLATVRQQEGINKIKQTLNEALTLAKSGINIELIVEHLMCGIKEIDEIHGRSASEDLLNHIFERFCIGK